MTRNAEHRAVAVLVAVLGALLLLALCVPRAGAGDAVQPGEEVWPPPCEWIDAANEEWVAAAEARGYDFSGWTQAPDSTWIYGPPGCIPLDEYLAGPQPTATPAPTPAEAPETAPTSTPAAQAPPTSVGVLSLPDTAVQP